MIEQKTIVVVLRSGGDFSFRDVELISRHIHLKWEGTKKPRIICIWDKATISYNLGNIEIIPMDKALPGTWSRMQLYSPEMEKYKPFLYVDLDTAIIKDIQNIINLVKNPWNYIPLEDFYQKGQLATGLVWFPPEHKGTQRTWEAFKKTGVTGNRMDYFLRKHIVPDVFWQQLTGTIVDFKPKGGKLLEKIEKSVNIVCFHGKPRIFEAQVDWVKQYVNQY